jgi:hypothetical protein
VALAILNGGSGPPGKAGGGGGGGGDGCEGGEGKLNALTFCSPNVPLHTVTARNMTINLFIYLFLLI